MSRTRPARAARRLALAAALVPMAGAAPAGAAQFTPIIHLNACDRAQKCQSKQGTAAGNIVALVRARKPELLTLNEICSGSVDRIARATGYKQLFTQAGQGLDCQKGRGQFGNAILAAPQRTLDNPYRYQYRAQNARTGEKRLLTCADSSGALVCTTHLDFTGVARRQGQELRTQLRTLLATRNPLMFLGADLNLNPAATRQYALPREKLVDFNDGRVMHIFRSRAFGTLPPGIVIKSALNWTDHAGLQLRANAPGR